ncbi:uncharacterized protein PgNI_02174 [Pyricularia grisea]|uniref:Uncharacterized protein n=1 Tax=Pyricularia grisea TaxID=148305 RepID=A0A6P8BIW0_PYRGI|nr:uncharacterized protein PgNI_02174 [Pyricularia grisea]TLD16650.1 hypothetical protein PgNI_02174 [Pyricularia grisea]
MPRVQLASGVEYAASVISSVAQPTSASSVGCIFTLPAANSPARRVASNATYAASYSCSTEMTG